MNRRKPARWVVIVFGLPNGERPPHAGGLARSLPTGNTLYRIPARKIARFPASRLHAVVLPL